MRVPIISPSTAVKPIVLATLRPSRIAHRLAPLPRWATIRRASGQRGLGLAEPRDDVVVGQAVEAVAADAGCRELARQGEFLGKRRLVAVEGGVEAGDLRQSRGPPRRSPRWARGCAADAAGRAAPGASSFAMTAASTRVGAANSSPPWTTRWPNASTGRPASSSRAELQDLAGRAAMVEPARRPGPFRHHRARGIARASGAAPAPMFSTWPRNSRAPSAPAS